MPVIGYLSGESREVDASRLNGLRQGLNQAGYVERRNFVIEYRWAENQADRLPVLVDDLVQIQVTVIVAAGVIPTATIGFLGNPNNPIFELTTRDLLAAASIIGLKVEILKAGTDSEIDAVGPSTNRVETREVTSRTTVNSGPKHSRCCGDDEHNWDAGGRSLRGGRLRLVLPHRILQGTKPVMMFRAFAWIGAPPKLIEFYKQRGLFEPRAGNAA